MPALKQSEKRLLVAFLAALFIVVNLFVFTQVSKVQRSAESKVRKLESELLVMGDLLAEGDLWRARESWLAAKQPVFDESGERGATRAEVDEDLLNTIRATARKFAVTLEEEKLPEPEEHPHFVQAVARVSGVGSIEGIMRWIYELQKPQEFRAVTFFELRPQKDDPSILTCEMRLERWYAKADG